MSWIDTAIKRPIAVSMGAVTLLLFGLISLNDLPVNLLPDLAYPTLTVRTEYQGAAPEEIETLLTRPVEESVGVVKQVRSIKSVSRAGQSDVTLEFAWGRDMDRAGLEVREKLELLQLPIESKRPVLLRFNPSTEPIMRFGLAMEADRPMPANAKLKALRRYADEQLKKILEPLKGVAAVKVSGGLEDEIQINVDQEKLAQLNLSIAALRQRLASENINLSAGRVEEGTQRYLVRTMNQFSSLDDFMRLVVTPAAERTVYLSDIAEVTHGAKERQAIIRLNGEEAVEVAVYKEADANTVSVARGVREAVAKLDDKLPDGMRIETVDDQSTFVHQAIREVVQAALLGALLAVVVIFLFLRDLRSTFIIAVCIPLSIIATFFLMGQTGVGLNMMSLGGIALATGLLVDNAIVVLENIARHRTERKASSQAVSLAAREVGGAITASTLTTIAVFLPLAFVHGVAGQLFRDQALTVTYALLVSLVVALTLIPTMAYRRRQTHQRRTTQAAADKSIVAKFYARLLAWALRNKGMALSIAAGCFALAWWSLQQTGLELIPEMAQGQIEVTVENRAGTPLQETDKALGELQRLAISQDAVALAYGVSGTGNRIDANPTESGEHIGRMLVQLKPEQYSAEASVVSYLRDSVRQGHNKTNFNKPQLLSFAKPVELKLVGYDLRRLSQASESVTAKLKELPRLTDIESSIANGQPEIQIYFDQERVAALGMTVKQVADRVVSKVRGDIATRYHWRDRKVDVLVRLGEAERQSVQAIRDLIINPESEFPLTLSAVAEVRVTRGPAEIRRDNQERVALITTNLAYGDLSTALSEINNALSDVTLPPGVYMHVSGQHEEMQASFKSLLFALALAIFLVYLVMAAQFESLLHPFVILFSIPLAAVGVALALRVTGTSLNVIVFIGLIMLTGIVVNNAIVLIDTVNQLRREGMEKTPALQRAAELRLRPILMTTVTTVLGLLPLALGIGEGAEVRAPMAITVIGGLLVATLLTLVIVPVMYAIFDRRKMQTMPRTEASVLGEGPV